MARKRLLAVAAVAVLAGGAALVLISGDTSNNPFFTNSADPSAPGPRASKATKPICGSPVNPNVAAPTADCVPAHIANLPPEPGPEDKKRIEGTDANGNGIWDHPERWVVQNYGHDPLAVQTLFVVVKAKQVAVSVGDSLSREETQKLMQVMLNAGICFNRNATPEMEHGRALQLAEIEVANTPERFVRAQAFNYKVAHAVYSFDDQTTEQACGFDPTKFAPTATPTTTN